MVSCKLTYDRPYSNKNWADFANLDLAFLNEMEKELLSIINYDLYITKNEFDHFIHNLALFMSQCEMFC